MIRRFRYALTIVRDISMILCPASASVRAGVRDADLLAEREELVEVMEPIRLGPAAELVQGVNDMLAGTDGYLSPENSVLVLDLGWATVGTAGVSDSVKWQWMSDLLVHPERGVIKHARPDGVGAIRRVADLLASKAGGAADLISRTT